MPFVLKLTDGTNSVDFMDTAGGAVLMDGGFSLSSSDREESWSGGGLFSQEGPQLVAIAQENRKAEITFSVHGATPTLMTSHLNDIQKLVKAAQRRSIRSSGARVTLEYAWASGGNTSYFEVLSGGVTWPEDVLSIEQASQQDASGEYVIWGMQLELILAPMAYDVSPSSGSPVSLPLSNFYGTDETDGLLVTLNPVRSISGDEYNWVEVSGEDIPGGAGTKLVLEITHVFGSGAIIPRDIYIGARARDFSFSRILSASSIDVPAIEVDGDVIGNAVATFTVENEPNVFPGPMGTWTGADLDSSPSRGVYRAFMVSRNEVPKNTSYRLTIGTEESPTFQGGWVKPIRVEAEYMLDLGILDFGASSRAPLPEAQMTVNLYSRKDYGSADAPIEFVCIILHPIEEGYRVLRSSETSASDADEERFVDDGWEDIVYSQVLQSATYKTRQRHVGLLRRLELTPGVTTRLYFLTGGSPEGELAPTYQLSQKVNELVVRVLAVGTYDGLV